MKTAKQELTEMLEKMPDDASMDQLVLEIQFVAGVLRGLADIERGDVVSQEHVEARLAAWLESSGREKLFET